MVVALRQGRQRHVGADRDPALGADGTTVRRRDQAAVGGRRAEAGGGAQHLDGPGEVEQLQAVEGHDDHVVGGGGHGDIIGPLGRGSNVIFLMIPATLAGLG